MDVFSLYIVLRDVYSHSETAEEEPDTRGAGDADSVVECGLYVRVYCES